MKTIVGSSGKETVSVGGSAEAGAHKIVSLGGGNDFIYSGGESTTTAGNTFHFNANDGKDTISGFGFYQGAEDDPELEAADLLLFDVSASEWAANGGLSLIKGLSNRVEIGVNSTDKVVLSGADKDDIIRVQFDGTDAYNVKIGSTSSKTNFAYDTDTQIYIGNTSSNNDTVTAAGDGVDVAMWLGNYGNATLSDPDGTLFYGVRTLDATTVINGNATLVGNTGENNTLYGAGSGSSSSLWGGSNSNNVLIGGAGEDTFIFARSNNANDTIVGCSTSDIVRVSNLTIADIENGAVTSGEITSNSVSLTFNDGSSLLVNATGSTVTFQIDDGIYEANTSTRQWA